MNESVSYSRWPTRGLHPVGVMRAKGDLGPSPVSVVMRDEVVSTPIAIEVSGSYDVMMSGVDMAGVGTVYIMDHGTYLSRRVRWCCRYTLSWRKISDIEKVS